VVEEHLFSYGMPGGSAPAYGIPATARYGLSLGVEKSTQRMAEAMKAALAVLGAVDSDPAVTICEFAGNSGSEALALYLRGAIGGPLGAAAEVHLVRCLPEELEPSGTVGPCVLLAVNSASPDEKAERVLQAMQHFSQPDQPVLLVMDDSESKLFSQAVRGNGSYYVPHASACPSADLLEKIAFACSATSQRRIHGIS
jgi:hypothetical protein